MFPDPSRKTARLFSRHVFVRILLLLVVSCLSFAALSLPIAIRPSTYTLKVSEVSPVDIQAPRAMSFQSELLTRQAQQEAESAVQPVYLPADPIIARRQIEKLRVSLNYIDTVRRDAYGSLDQKIGDLSALSGVTMPADLARRILALNDNRWQIVEQESLNVLERVMRNAIRDDQVDDSRRSIPTLISYSLPEDQALIISELVTSFVVPNSLYSEEQTQAERKAALEAVKPVTRSYVAGETIVLRGQVITPVTWEALEQFGLVQPSKDYPDLIASGALILLVAVFTYLFINQRRITNLNATRNLVMIGLTFLVFLFGARLVIPNRAIVPYLYPMAAFGLTVSTLFSMEAGLVFSLVLSILAAYGLQNALDLTLFYTLSSLCGVLILGKGRRVANFFWTGLAIGAAGSAVILAYRLPDFFTNWIGIAQLTGAALFNGLASASLTLLLQFLFSQVLGLTTALQLLDLLRPDHPLLQFMLRQAPGSYQHSLQVANLAEQAAEAIGADGLLVRVGAIYHDCGKAANPSYFIENQIGTKLNPHDDLDPAASAATIIRHVEDGVVFARKHRLPPAVQDFIREHHGTLLARYQYAKAMEAAGGDPEKVDKARFRYPGPKPRSRETALLMLADGVEARARAELPKDEGELRALVKKVFDFIHKEEQLEDTRLTFRDLSLARETFVTTLLNSYHPRIQYPEIKSAPAAAEQSGEGQTTAESRPAAENVPTVQVVPPKQRVS